MSTARLEIPVLIRAGVAGTLIGILSLFYSTALLAQYENYEGSDTCGQSGCHTAQYQAWQASGHPFKLMKGEDARNRPIPLPEGYSWDEISYVIGGYKWKSRYIDTEGYIITQGKGDEPGNTQYNYLTGTWSDYNADQPNGTKPYDCGRCHTTGWIPNDNPADTTGNQDGLPGMHGRFFTGGVHCEHCHGTLHPGDIPSMDDRRGCGACHVRGDPDTIPAKGGFIRHHEQYNEHLAGAHGSRDCVMCHNPHSRGEFSIKENAQCGVSCHRSKLASYMESSMYDYGVTCEDCHMPYATKSAQALGPYEGDVMTHIFRIDTDPAANMFTEDGGFVKLDDNGEAKVTMDFACQRCHETASLSELARFANNFHDRGPTSLEGLGIDPGLSGHWWFGPDRSGEGFMFDVSYSGGQVYMFVSFYAHDPDSNQVWMFAQGSVATDATSAELEVYLPVGGTWGAGMDPDDVERILVGTLSVDFPDCYEGSMALDINAAGEGLGFTDLEYDINRELLEPGVACPTFDNRSGRVAAQ
jgi:hypothetical protein